MVSLSIPKQILAVPGHFLPVNESYSLCVEAPLAYPTLKSMNKMCYLLACVHKNSAKIYMFSGIMISIIRLTFFLFRKDINPK